MSNPMQPAGSQDLLVRRADSTSTLRELRWPRNNEAASDAAFREINRLTDDGWINVRGVERYGDEWGCLLLLPPTYGEKYVIEADGRMRVEWVSPNREVSDTQSH